MKANELESKDLMIGDLVYACIEEEIVGEAKYKIISKIRDLKDNGDFTIEFVGRCPDGLDWQDGDDISWIEPIPLTDEILEKNFPEPTDGITWYPEEGGFNCHTYVPDYEINAFGLFKYVHQLQNALRLVGIEKEIKI